MPHNTISHHTAVENKSTCNRLQLLRLRHQFTPSPVGCRFALRVVPVVRLRRDECSGGFFNSLRIFYWVCYSGMQFFFLAGSVALLKCIPHYSFHLRPLTDRQISPDAALHSDRTTDERVLLSVVVLYVWCDGCAGCAGVGGVNVSCNV